MRIKGAWLVILMAIASPAWAEVDVRTTGIGHGVEVWYATNDAIPVVDLQISFEGAGYASDPEGKGGRAAFAASMLNEGAGTLDSAAFQRALEERAITFEAETNADRLTIHIHCLREHAKRAGELLAMALGQPLLAESDQARVKTQFASLFAQLEESPGYQASRLLEQRAFKGHPYANAPYGTPETLAALGAQDIRDFMKTYITRGNLLVAAAGDVDRGLLGDMLDPMVEVLADNDAGAVAVTPVTLQGGGESLKQVMALPQSVVAFAAPAVARDDARFYAAYLLNHILGGNALISRLSNQVRQQKGLVYSVNSDLDLRRGTTMIEGALATRNSSADAALEEVKTVLAQLRDKGVSTEECADAKSYVLGSFPLQLDSSANVAGVLMMMQINHLGEDYLKKREKLFTGVSCSDINAVAEQLLAPQRFLFATVGGTVDAPGPVAPVHDDAR